MSRTALSASEDPPRLRPVPRSFFRRDPREVAPELLNKLLVRGVRVARIVEVEAYCGSGDPASHAYRGRTPRNATMFEKAGLLYVYFSYGMHWCANAVCGEVGEGVAVLLRAVSPVRGASQMRRARGYPERDRDIGSGPAKLCQALGITKALDGADLVTGDRGLKLATDGLAPPDRPGQGSRVGISVAREHPWRWWVPGDPNVSRGS